MPYTDYPRSYSMDRQLLLNELVQLGEQGLDAVRRDGLRARVESLPETLDPATFEAWWHRLEGVAVGLGDADEPDDLPGIRAARAAGPHRLSTLPPERLAPRVEAALLGRAVGCLLGKPVEGWARDRIVAYLQAMDAYPLRDYFPGDEAAAERYGLHPSWKDSVRGRIDGMPRDDDMDYPVVGLVTLERCGLDFRPDDVGATWLSVLPYHTVYTAERVAYANLVRGLTPPASGLWANPYREWIGAQIRADVWGYVAAGWPERAAELGWRDAVISHSKNGIYGEMYFAALIAAAFTASSLDAALDAALAEIPRDCRFARMTRQVRGWAREIPTWEECWARIDEVYGVYNRVHTLNNAAFVLAALLYGGDDFERVIEMAVMSGCDTDCNGATAGSVVAALYGREVVPDRWLEPIDGRLRSVVFGNTDLSFADVARRIARFAAG